MIILSSALLNTAALAQSHAPASITSDASTEQGFDNAAALKLSQAAIGRALGDYTFTKPDGSIVRLSAYRGKPLIISLVYTGCYHTCPMTTQHLARAVGAARQALGKDSFNVLTIGFDTANDTPRAMEEFAQRQHVALPHWDFLSAHAPVMHRLIDDLGFIYQPSPKGFDHLIQSSVIDAEGRVYRQVYGERFEIPWLVEPLKQLVYGTRAEDSGWAELVKRVRLFCTTYDPASGAYRFDYSLFVGMAIGLSIIGGGIVFLIRSMRQPHLH